MSVLGGFRYSSSLSGCPATDSIVNVATFAISGLANTSAIGCCLYVWNPATNQWEPMTQP